VNCIRTLPNPTPIYPQNQNLGNLKNYPTLREGLQQIFFLMPMPQATETFPLPEQKPPSPDNLHSPGNIRDNGLWAQRRHTHQQLLIVLHLVFIFFALLNSNTREQARFHNVQLTAPISRVRRKPLWQDLISVPSEVNGRKTGSRLK